MSKRNDRDFRNNATNRRGVVVERDPKNMRVKVRFEDEDNTVSYWIDVLGGSSNGVSYFGMPGEEDEVWCAIDAKGESGCLLGSRYNDKERPPHDTNADIAVVFPGGFVHINTGSGNISVKTPGVARIDAGDIELISNTLTHNGKNIGHDHKHTDVMPGPALTGEPA